MLLFHRLSRCMLHFAIKRKLSQNYTYTHILLSNHAQKGPSRRPGMRLNAQGTQASIHLGTPSDGKPCLPPLLSMPGPGRKVGNRAEPPGSPAICTAGLAWRGLQSLSVRGPIFSPVPSRNRAGGGLRSGVRDQGPFWGSHWSSALRQPAYPMWLQQKTQNPL